MFGGSKLKKNGERGMAVVVDSDYTGSSNSHGERKYKLTLRVRTADGTMVDAQCKAYGISAGDDTNYRAGATVPVFYDAKDPSDVEVDRDTLTAGRDERQREAREGLARLAEERLAAGDAGPTGAPPAP